jgi:hypothetical protein
MDNSKTEINAEVNDKDNQGNMPVFPKRHALQMFLTDDYVRTPVFPNGK